jgi:CheY-like chemotaxis protein
MPALIIGIYDCPELNLYGAHLARSGHTVIRFPAGAVSPETSALVVCEDHFFDPAVQEACKAFERPKIVIASRDFAGKISGDFNLLALPVLPLDLERSILEAVSGKDNAASGKIPRIVVVEDDPTTAQALISILELKGYHVEVCEDSRKVSAAIQIRPDLVILDLNLPDMPGETIGKMVKEHGIPIVIHSSDSRARLDAACESLQAIAAFQKGSSFYQFMTWLQEYFGDRR